MPDTPPPEHVALEISLGNELAAEIELQLAEARAKVRRLAGLIDRLKAAEPVRLGELPDDGDPKTLPVADLLKQLGGAVDADRARPWADPGEPEPGQVKPTGSDGS